MAPVTITEFRLDTSPTGTYGLGDKVALTADTTPTVIGIADPNSTVHLALQNQYGSTLLSINLLSDANGNWIYSSSQLADGLWSFTASNPSRLENSTKSIFIDTTPPTASIYSGTLNASTGDIEFRIQFHDNSDQSSFFSGAPITYTRPPLDSTNFTINEHGVSGSYVKSITPFFEFPTYGYKVAVHVSSGAGSVSLTLDVNKAPITDQVGNALASNVTSKDVSVGAEAVIRFYDTSTGNHFYTTASNEKAQIEATLPAFKYEGVQWGAPVIGNEVYRFFDTVTKDHFFTASTNERDSIMANPSREYVYEGVAFHAFDSTVTGAVTLERFFNKISGVHHFSANADETASIKSGAQGLGWVDEGAAFAVSPPTHDLVIG